MKSFNGLVFEFASTPNQNIRKIDRILKKL
jgi:hypothetical protein